MEIKTVIKGGRCDDYRHTQRKYFSTRNQAENKQKGKFLNSNGTDKNKSFGC